MTGQRIGVYHLQERIGAGGMGEVYRARDTRLGRDVAIKILPPAFTADPDRLARFEREARVLASLNHPNIATLHGIEDALGVRALVMELVDGPTLADRLADSPMPVAEALGVARQIADALEVAHEKGIIHRDLKPANVKVTPTGVVKLLDFGLAKAVEGDVAGPNLSQMPTITVGATGEGMIVGTAAYMSPEQARGQSVDKRTDIWALGCVMYEMLTGRAAFGRSTVSDTLAAILGIEPEWEALPKATPTTIRRLLKRCLEKDARRRIHHVADVRIEIEDALAPPSASASRAEGGQIAQGPESGARTWRRAALALGVIALVAGGLTVRNLTRPEVTQPDRQMVRYAIHLRPGDQFPIDTGLPLTVAISPGGDQVVYAARDAGGDRLFLRRRDDLEGSPIPGTEGAIGPFFSPDSQWIGFASGGLLRAVPADGGAPRTLVESPNLAGASWGPNDIVVYSQWNSRLFRVSALGGRPEPVTTLDERRGEFGHTAPHVLPDGRTVLFSVQQSGGQFVEAADIATGTRRRLIDGRNPVYVASGHIVFARASTLFTVPFDLARLEVTGPATELLGGVRADGNDTHFAVAGRNALVYVPELSRDSRLIWIDREGRTRPLDAEQRRYTHPRVSPDGTRVVLTLPRATGGSEIWIYDTERGTRVRLSPGGSRPVWTADGKRITFQMDRGLYSVPADDSAAPQLILAREEPDTSLFPLAWSTDGRVLMFSAPTPATNRDVWVLPRDGVRIPFLKTSRDERAAMFSPDGRWVVYADREPGREEQVYVQPYPGPGGRVVISPDGGIEPVWSPTGREIFYRSVDGARMMSVDVRTDPSLVFQAPRLLFAGRFLASDGSFWSNYDVSRDGREFLMLEASETPTAQLNVVLNWTGTLK
jgi:Tol biopolymer transport system component